MAWKQWNVLRRQKSTPKISKTLFHLPEKSAKESIEFHNLTRIETKELIELTDVSFLLDSLLKTDWLGSDRLTVHLHLHQLLHQSCSITKHTKQFTAERLKRRKHKRRFKWTRWHILEKQPIKKWQLIIICIPLTTNSFNFLLLSIFVHFKERTDNISHQNSKKRRNQK